MKITEGVFSDGMQFKLEDDWRLDGHAHRVLDRSWTGCTTFSIAPVAASSK